MVLLRILQYYTISYVAFFHFYAQKCTRREIFILDAKDYRLKDSLIYEEKVNSLLDCAHLCLSQRPKCKSTNYEKNTRKSKCQLNNHTRSTKPEKMVPNKDFNYYEPIPVRDILYEIPTVVNVVFQPGRNYRIRNVKTKRLLFSKGSVISGHGFEGGTANAKSAVGTDSNYYNRGYWRIKHQGENKYIIQNHKTKRYLFSTGYDIIGDRGCERGITEAPACVDSDDNYDGRALWFIVAQKDGKYLIQSVVNFRYVFSLGEAPVRNEGGWNRSPRCVMSDANYEDRALWDIT